MIVKSPVRLRGRPGRSVRIARPISGVPDDCHRRHGADQGFLDLRSAVDRLRQTSFHFSAEILGLLIETK